MDIDSVQQGTRKPRLIVACAFGRPPAGPRRIGKMPAAAGIHRGDKLKARRISHMRVRASDHGRTRLDWLPQRIQDGSLEFDNYVAVSPDLSRYIAMMAQPRADSGGILTLPGEI